MFEGLEFGADIYIPKP